MLNFFKVVYFLWVCCDHKCIRVKSIWILLFVTNLCQNLSSLNFIKLSINLSSQFWLTLDISFTLKHFIVSTSSSYSITIYVNLNSATLSRQFIPYYCQNVLDKFINVSFNGKYLACMQVCIINFTSTMKRTMVFQILSPLI